jgi:hypothetical protein
VERSEGDPCFPVALPFGEGGDVRLGALLLAGVILGVDAIGRVRWVRLRSLLLVRDADVPLVIGNLLAIVLEPTIGKHVV